MADIQTAPASVSGKKKYRGNQRKLYSFPDMVTLVPTDLNKPISDANPGISVALGEKDVTRKLPATGSRPETTLVSKAATQAQLEYLFKVEKNPLVEEYD